MSIKKLVLLVLLIAASSVVAIAQQSKNDFSLDRESLSTPRMLRFGLREMTDTVSFPKAFRMGGDKVRVVYCDKIVDDYYLIVASNHKALRFFTGIAQIKHVNNNYRFLWGTLYGYEKSSEGLKCDMKYPVRFDVNSDLTDLITLSAKDLNKAYNFEQNILAWNCPGELRGDDLDYYKQNSATGFVGETTGGFYPEKLYLRELLQFNGLGGGKAIQLGGAEGREEYIGNSKNSGPRGGYRADGTSGGAVEYGVSVDRSQPMTYTYDKDTKLLKLNYSQPATGKVTYTHATTHPVMSQIKASYSKWMRVAPARYQGSEEWVLAGILSDDFLVIRAPQSNPDDPSEYIFIPAEGLTEEVSHPIYEWEKIKRQMVPSKEMFWLMQKLQRKYRNLERNYTDDGEAL